MSDFGKPQPCRNQCGAWIYFDRDSEIGHPSADKWVPLVYENDTGLRTNTAHQCLKSPYSKSQSQQPQPTQQASTTIVTQATQNDMIIRKLDRIISALESQNRMIGLLLDPQQKQKLSEYEREAGK